MKTKLSFCSVKKIAMLIFFALSLMILSCSDDGSGFIKVTADYCSKTNLDCNNLPEYHIGDYQLGDDEVKTKVTGTTTFDGKIYFTITDGSDTWYERVEGNKHFMKWNENDDETLRGDLSVDVGTQWQTPYIDGTTLTVELMDNSAEITINGVTFTNGFEFGVTISNQPSGYNTVFYLPGLGFVAQQYYVNGIPQVSGSWKIVEFKLKAKVYKIQP